jgi:hypothetical protein
MLAAVLMALCMAMLEVMFVAMLGGVLEANTPIDGSDQHPVSDQVISESQLMAMFVVVLGGVLEAMFVAVLVAMLVVTLNAV